MAFHLSPAQFAAKAGEAADLLRALGHEARLMVLCQLVEGERSAGALQEGSGLSQSALSQHLAKLREAGLVATRREAQTIYYSLADAKAERVIETLAALYCPPPKKARK
ncbi:MAG TPA: metalloregulator ArsR/SmtB family transcription factor [Terricaulis sp.]|nr:metalloregulator ArsR/SmtB family transcription factor [Terricaulis sp.]HRP09866.1 metalloregulator ArsR/SmtB family transcription factor [Terricaulis sp.]